MKELIILCLISLSTIISNGQSLEDLLDELPEENDSIEQTLSTFKSIRLINSHTIKNPEKNKMYMLISHRFGEISQGFSQMFGLDNATIRLGFEYGINNELAVGFGRSGYNSNYDIFAKYKILSQSEGQRNIPLSLSILGVSNITSAKWTNPDRDYLFSHRLSYTVQLLAARKFNNSISIQLMPTYIHRNLVEGNADENDVFAVGIGGRIKITNRFAFTYEYHYTLPGSTADNFINPLSAGFDIETGGHVFQLFFTNADAMYDAGFIPETTNDWSEGKIRFGFNISRLF